MTPIKTEKEAHDLWFSLIQKGMDKAAFETICTLLRPCGMHDSGWDVLDESEATFDDFNWMLKKSKDERGIVCARRLALHYYCFIIEMSPIHEMIMNLLRCMAGERYSAFPFAHLNKKQRKGKGLREKLIPPSMPTKIREIITLAKTLNQDQLIENITYIFDAEMRNAIAHSDYILTDKEIRLKGNGPSNVIELKELDQKIGHTFLLISGLLRAYKNMKYVLGKSKRFHQMDNFEVLELLSDENGLYGFNVHFSNDSKSTFTRTKEGVTQINMTLRNGVGFMAGDLDAMKPIWKVNGAAVTDWNALNNVPKT